MLYPTELRGRKPHNLLVYQTFGGIRAGHHAIRRRRAFASVCIRIAFGSRFRELLHRLVEMAKPGPDGQEAASLLRRRH